MTGIFLLALSLPFIVGAAEKPTKDLEKAIKSGKKSILFEGKENEDITVKSGVSIVGTDPGKSIISGDIKLENGAALSNLTVSGKTIPITIAKGASVTLSNVTVRGGEDAGIVALEGGGTLTLKNSRVTKNRKGLYILPGKNLLISGNRISENREEGLDVRTGTSGVIAGNQFLNNGEGGAEIIAGSARLVIQGNTFAGNKADGLTMQSYTGGGKAPGSVKIIGNTFSDNRSFGLSCQSPSLGGADAAFYRRSISASDNIFRGNQSGVIDRECGGVINRISLQKEDEKSEKTEAIEEESWDEELANFEAAVAALHSAESVLESHLAEKERDGFIRIFKLKPITTDEKQALETEFAALDEHRDRIATFPHREEPVIEDRRQSVLIESLRRKTELHAALEKLERASFPLAFLMFLF